MQNSIWKKPLGAGCVLVACGLLVGRSAGQTCQGWTPTGGEVCVCHDIAPQQVTVCFTKDGAAPVENVDFKVDFDCPGCDAAPDVELINGNPNWRIWAVPFGGGATDPPPADLGIIDSPHDGNFEVTLAQPDGDPGALNVAKIDLSPTGGFGSNLLGGVIAGDLNDLLRVKETSGGLGGFLTLEVQGRLNGQSTIPNVQDLVIGDGLGASGAIMLVGEIVAGGQIKIGPALGACATGATPSTSPIDIDLISQGGQLLFDGNVTGHVTVDQINGGSVEVQGGVDNVRITVGGMDPQGAVPALLAFSLDTASGCSFYGDLTLQDTLVPSTSIELHGEFKSGASIDMGGNAISGAIDLNAGGAGNIVNAGTVSFATGIVTLADAGSPVGGDSFAGDAGFASIINGGTVRTLGGADLTGKISTTGAVGASSSISISGDVGAGKGIDIGDDVIGAIDITGKLTGDVHAAGNLSGDVIVGSTVNGDIDIDGDVTSTGSIQLSGTLRTGRILVDGLLDGPITINDGTGNLSQINLLGGVGSGGKVEINAGEGSWHAGGDIWVGSTVTLPPLSPIDFDGCIQINDDGAGGSGNLNGDITVVGCHAAGDTVDICVEGDTNGTISLIQSLCANTATLDSSCPACP